MPDRIVRAGILTSDAVNTLSWPAEVLYRRLHSIVDDYGRYDGRSSLLRAHLYPLKIDKVSEADVGKWLTECVTAGLVSFYRVAGRPYVEVTKFGARVRAETSKWPASDDAEPQSRTTADICAQPHADAAVFVGVVVDVFDKPPHPPAGGAEGFDAFWTAWPKHPRKVAQRQCRDKWRKAGCEPITARIVAHVNASKASEAWLKSGGEFIPAPMVYLNQNRWEAEPAALLSVPITVSSSDAGKTARLLAEQRAHADEVERQRIARMAVKQGATA